MLKKLDALRGIFSVSGNDPELTIAQYRALARQMPLLYFTLIANTLSVAFDFVGKAPLWLALVPPLPLCIIGIFRAWQWWHTRNAAISIDKARRALMQTNRLAVFMAVTFTAWGLALYPYGDMAGKDHIFFYMAITVVACIFCLMHLRSAALIVTTIVNTPFIAYFLIVGDAHVKALTVNLASVSVAMILMLVNQYRDFSALVQSRRALIDRQAETQALSDENFRMANLDTLTNLPNRRSFFHDLEKHWQWADAEGTRFAVGVIDLDGFKPINDTFGHSAGDKVLSEAAERFRMACPLTGCDVSVYRLGGDEFGLIVQGYDKDENLTEIGYRFIEALRPAFAVGNIDAQIACSIGMASRTLTPRDALGLYECADYALYYAKRTVRGRTVLFTEQHEADIRSQSSIERHLRAADFDHEFSLRYQPIIDLTTGETIAFEALARWFSPELGTVSPDVFIPAAERAGLISRLTQSLLTQALLAMNAWPYPVGLSFNLSAHDICAADNMVNLVDLISKSGIDPARIDFEITETAMAYDFIRARQSIVALKALGCHISLDDFGTGYSSLSYIHQLPLDRIKVDRSFMIDMSSNSTSRKIVRSVSGLCQDMGLKSIIEGVETPEQLQALRDMKCDFAQGYLFARPMAEEDIAGYLSGRTPATPYQPSVSAAG